MHRQNKRINILRIRQLRIGSALLLAAAFLFTGATEVSAANLKWDYLYGSHENDEIGSTVRNNVISFENDKVEAGVPLRVLGAPEGSAYLWTVTGADGTENTFTTADNFYTPVEMDMEKLITVTVDGLEGAEAAIYFSTLPVVYINNTAGYYGVNDEYTDAVMSIQGSAQFSGGDQFYNGGIKIRLRGRSTRYREKRPFNIKLDTKSNLLGMGKNKRWALLANDIDHTLMRNKLLYDFSGAIGMETYMQSEFVTVIFNNRYYGVYQLSESVNVGSERVDIYEWEESAETAAEAIAEKLHVSGELSEENAGQARDDLEDAMCMDFGWITSPHTFSYDVNQDGSTETYTITDYVELPEATGGALVELDMGVYDGNEASVLISAYAQPLFFDTPEYAVTNNALFDYTKKYLQAFEYAIHSTDFIYHESDKKYRYVDDNLLDGIPGVYEENIFNAPEYEGKHYSELFDLNSLVRNFLVCEFSINLDSMRCSGYMYKDIDGLFRMGPEWDFDWAWGNINMYNVNTNYPDSWQTTEEKIGFQTEQWNRPLIKDPYFIVQAYQKYKEIRGTAIEDIIKEGGQIDGYRNYLQTAAAANDARWSYTYAQYRSFDFNQSINQMKSFIDKRLDWLDAQFESPDTLIASLRYYKSSPELIVSRVDTNTSKDYAKITAVVTNPAIASVAFQVNGTRMYTAEVADGWAICEVPASDLAAEKEQLNVVQLLARNAAGEYILDTVVEGNYYSAKSNYAVFTSEEGFVNAETGGINPTPAGSLSQEASGQAADRADSPTVFIIVIVVIVLALGGISVVLIQKARKRK
jgi:hypothetical protein